MTDRAALIWIWCVLAVGLASSVFLLLTGDARALVLSVLAGLILRKALR